MTSQQREPAGEFADQVWYVDNIGCGDQNSRFLLSTFLCDP